MKFVVLNPNTTEAMTQAVVASLQPHLPASAEVLGLTAREGCAVIDSRASFAMGARQAPRLLADVPVDADGILLACFGDPGLDALRAGTTVRVVGLAEAAIQQARQTGKRFAILTAGREWIPMLEECVAGHGAAALLEGVHALDGNGAALQRDPGAFTAAVAQLAEAAASNGAEVLILGGAAFAGIDYALPARLMRIDPIEAAARQLRGA